MLWRMALFDIESVCRTLARLLTISNTSSMSSVVKYFLRLFADVFVTAAFGVRGAGVLIKSGRAGKNQAFDAFRVAFCENQGYVASQGVA